MMLGLASNLFTAVYVTRVIFDWLLAKGLIKDRLMMMSLVPVPRIDWMKLRPVFFTLSGLAIVAGMFVFFTRDPVTNNKYDIEFTGGMSVQLNFKEGVTLTRQDVQDRLQKAAQGVSAALQAANVTSVGTTGRQFEITTTETNKTHVTVTFPEGQVSQTVQSVQQQIDKVQEKAGSPLRNLMVQEGDGPGRFAVTTTQMNTALIQNTLAEAFPNATISKPVVDEVVKRIIETSFANELAIQHNLEPQIVSTARVNETVVEAHPVLADFMGGLVIECKISQPVPLQEIDQRLGDLLFKPDAQKLGWSTYKLLGPGLTEVDAIQPVTGFAYVTVHPEAGLRQFSEEEWSQYEDTEKTRVLTAASLETSLPRVTQIDPSIGGEQKTRALIAIILSVAAMMAYIWIRFGTLRYGIGAVITLVHDVCIMLGAVTVCTFVAKTAIGQSLLIGDFKIDLNMIAAFLTLVGYSLNDTIVVYDRIRENRQKAQLTPATINASINQTMSRTLITSVATLVVVWIMYFFGGAGLRGFNFCIGLGIIVGTYSSIAISAPALLFSKKAAGESKS
jgi:SecD/SecF fusion protein